MKFSDFQRALQDMDLVRFHLPNGHIVPMHYHITEIARVQKDYIDCGGTVRSEAYATFQLYHAGDLDHRLSTMKLEGILQKAVKLYHLADLELLVEYQGSTVETYSMQLVGSSVHLVPTKTDCLAKDKCGIPEPMTIAQSENSCTPGSGCC